MEVQQIAEVSTKVSMQNFLILIYILSFLSFEAAAQAPNPSVSPSVRPRVIYVPSAAPGEAQATQQQTPIPSPTVTPKPSPIVTPNPNVKVVPSASPGFPAASPSPRPTVQPTPVINATPSPTPYLPTISPALSYAMPKSMLTLGQFRTRLAEAKRLLQTRPKATAMVDDKNNLLDSAVTIALLDPKTNLLQTVSLSKETFLTLYQESPALTSQGKIVRVRTIRANGVNTAIIVFDESNSLLVPIVVQYPVERGGKFYEMAYYVSAHPALMSSETARAGQLYIRATLETALTNLRTRGKFIAPAVIAEAEKLCIVEHVDHQRFLTENRAALYNEIFTLFALNEGSTYRYAVSTAGAGGLVQMIPSTYRMVRAAHPDVFLMPDFVEGMRNHVNAMQAMLLYMQDTYSDLIANETISAALSGGTATEGELMAAGYNSNPARLPLYIRRSSQNWRVLIPRETQMYLQIQSSIESTITPLLPVK
ncbi:MAG: hypothetical protein ABI954_03785 [Pyrinomonadaceae bacterium]